MKFLKDVLFTALTDMGDSDHPDVDKINTVVDRQIGKRRWVAVNEWIFEFEGKFYRTTYESGLTEKQDTEPFEYAPAEIECDEVFPVEVKVIKYMNEAEKVKHEATV